jgi:hypothetical protein
MNFLGRGFFRAIFENTLLTFLFFLSDVVIQAQLPGPAGKIIGQKLYNLFYTMRPG